MTVAGAAIVGINNSREDALTSTVEQSADDLQIFDEEAQLEQSPIDALAESPEPEEVVLHDEVGWSQAYSMILEHIPDRTLNTVSEVGLYGFEKEVYDNLTERGGAI